MALFLSRDTMALFLMVFLLFRLADGDNTGGSLNTTVCFFEGNMCGWTNDRDEASHSDDWYNFNDLASATRDDHTFGTYTGYYMALDPKKYTGSTSTRRLARLTSPSFVPGDKYCIQLYYILSGVSANPIKVYAKEYAGLGYPILTLQPKPHSGWNYAQVEIDSEYTSTHFQVVIEGSLASYRSYSFGRYTWQFTDQKAVVDDVYVTNTGCGNVPRCPKQTFTHTDGDIVTCLYFNTTAATWEEAVTSCRKMSPFGHLVSVESQQKQKTLISYIDGHSDSHIAAQHGVWTSGVDIDSEGNWVWSNTQQRFNYTDWKPGQPNNVGDRQDCLALDYPHENYSWGDEYCNLQKPFICQMMYNRSVVDSI